MCTRSVSRGRPSVRVPVLSKTTRVTFRAVSMVSALRKRMPWRAPRPVPARIAVGVASPSAQGHAMIRTEAKATVAKRARGSGPRTNQATHVTIASRQDHRHEHAGDLVGEPLDRRFGGLRLLHEAHDLGQCGPAADGGRLHLESAIAVDRAAENPVARGLGDRNRLSGDHRLVDRRASGPHGAVHGNGVAGLDPQNRADVDQREIDLAFSPVRDQPCLFRRQLEELADGRRRSAARAGLQIAAEQNQGEDHAHGLVVDGLHPAAGASSRREGLRKHGRSEREQERGRRARRDQRVHVGGPVAQGLERAFQERGTGPQIDRKRQQQQHPVAAGEHPVRHRDDHDRSGQRRGHQSAAEHFPDLSARGLLLLGWRLRAEGRRAVAAGAHGGDEPFGIEIASPDAGLRVAEVHRSLRDARNRRESRLDRGHAGGAVHALQGEVQRLGRRRARGRRGRARAARRLVPVRKRGASAERSAHRNRDGSPGACARP